MKLIRPVLLLGIIFLFASCEQEALDVQPQAEYDIEMRNDEKSPELLPNLRDVVEAEFVYDIMIQSEVGLSSELKSELDRLHDHYSIIEEELIIEGTIGTVDLIGDVIKIAEEDIIITLYPVEPEVPIIYGTADANVIWGANQKEFDISLKRGGEAIDIVYGMVAEVELIGDFAFDFENLIRKIEDPEIQNFYSTLLNMFVDRIDRIKKDCL